MALCSLLLSNLGPESWALHSGQLGYGFTLCLVHCKLSWKENVCQEPLCLPPPHSQVFPRAYLIVSKPLKTAVMPSLPIQFKPSHFVCYYKSRIRHPQTPQGQTNADCPPMVLLDTPSTSQTVNGQGRHLCAWQVGEVSCVEHTCMSSVN